MDLKEKSHFSFKNVIVMRGGRAEFSHISDMMSGACFSAYEGTSIGCSTYGLLLLQNPIADLLLVSAG